MCKRLHIHAICLRTHIIKHMIISVICTNMRKGNKFNHFSLSPKAAAMWAKSAMEKQGRMKGYGMDYSMKIVKEIYKSQVYCVKNKTFINFALENRR